MSTFYEYSSHRLKEAGRGEDGTWSFGNDVFSVTLDSELNPFERLPLFGAKYYFKLHEVVDLPEFLVHFPLLVRYIPRVLRVLKLCMIFMVCD